MKLYCVRHGEAQSADVDPERPLTEVGRNEIQRVADYLKRHHVDVLHVMHSPKLRAVQTAEIFSNTLGVEHINVCDTILNAEASVQPIVDMIHTWNEDTMIVGHLPYLYKLVSALILNDESIYPIVNYPPGTVICLDYFEVERWIIKWMLYPGIVS